MRQNMIFNHKSILHTMEKYSNIFSTWTSDPKTLHPLVVRNEIWLEPAAFTVLQVYLI